MKTCACHGSRYTPCDYPGGCGSPGGCCARVCVCGRKDCTEPTPLCALCPALLRRKPQHVETPQACPACRIQLAALPTEIADAYSWLGWTLLRPESGKRGDGRAASPEPKLPFPVDAHDLLAPTVAIDHPARLTVNADLQTGHLPVRETLGTWARDWADLRDLGEHGPADDVHAIAQWLAVRTDWAADHHPTVDDYAGELVQLRGTLTALVGRNEPDERPKRMPGVPCPRCRHVTLFRRVDADVECHWPDCQTVWRADEYEHITRAVASAVRRNRLEGAA